jgi:hypothetical protein
MTQVENQRTGGCKTLALNRTVLIKKLIVWVLVVVGIFALHDNPPRKTQAEVNNVQVAVETPKPEAKQVNETKPKVQEPVKPKPSPAPQPKQAEAPKPKPVVQGVTNCGDNVYKQYIYQKESGCRTNAINSSSGACGIGQALPCSKLPCTLSDFACQDAWFSNYAIQRYGSWEAAYNWWIRNHWW